MSSHGGCRKGAGSKGKKNGVTRITHKAQQAARDKAVSDGYLLPHEILLKAANGECFTQKKLVIIYHKSGPKKGYEKEREWVEEEYYPTVNEQIDAAKAAAQYYAPKLISKAADDLPGDGTNVDDKPVIPVFKVKPAQKEVSVTKGVKNG